MFGELELDKLRVWVAVDEACRSNNNQQGFLRLYNETVDTSCIVEFNVHEVSTPRSPRIFPCSKLMGAVMSFKVEIFSPLRNSLFAIILAPSHPYTA